jgi:hypothetical protein
MTAAYADHPELFPFSPTFQWPLCPVHNDTCACTHSWSVTVCACIVDQCTPCTERLSLCPTTPAHPLPPTCPAWLSPPRLSPQVSLCTYHAQSVNARPCPLPSLALLLAPNACCLAPTTSHPRPMEPHPPGPHLCPTPPPPAPFAPVPPACLFPSPVSSSVFVPMPCTPWPMSGLCSSM